MIGADENNVLNSQKWNYISFYKFMPELPEVQTVVDFLKDKLLRKTILSIQSPNGHSGVFENGPLKYYQNFLYKCQIQSIFYKLFLL